jgi:LEA14-like dessication related protein
MKLFIYTWFVLVLIFLSSCGDFQQVTFSGVEKVSVTKLSQEGVDAEITAKIKNPNNTAFTIYKSDMDVTIGGVKAGKAHLANNVRIKRNSEESYTFHVKSDFTDLSMMDIPKIISMAMSKNVKVGLKGNLNVGKLFVKRIFPVDITQSVPLDILK